MERRALLRRRTRLVRRRHGLDAGGRRARTARRLTPSWRLRRARRRRDAPHRAAGAVVADRTRFTDRAAVAEGFVAYGADRGLVVDGPAVARGAVVADGTALASRSVVAGRSWSTSVTGGRVVACPPLVAAPGGVFFAGRAPGGAVVADRTAVTHRRVVGRRHLPRVAVAGRLAATALRRDRRRLLWRCLRRRLAAARLRRPRGPVTPVRGRGAFAPRTTRTLGW
ncbi:hypothetical protein AB0F15_13935 [Amycolatopsis sp. NPDC026612]|uniref:hypothetical protein n=1 Tax=Amycolatopsis sp. NPDC026612 TaxID=3155466 RepID=UPI0033DEF8DD